jgi:SAM-dependent methyltransferase
MKLAPATNIPSRLQSETRRQLGHPELARTLNDEVARAAGRAPTSAVSTELHPGCQMLAHSLRAHGNASLAVSQYFGIALQQFATAMEVIERVARKTPDPEILDFACGFGRLLNLLVRVVPPERIRAAEIQPEAVSFVTDRFGVEAMMSADRPRDFDPGRRFDLIWVASLFSHLPPGLFQRWLRRLTQLLTPDGVLLFTVHDQALLPDDMPMPAEGMLFIAGSENPDLDPSRYGTTFVTEAYVRAAIEETVGRDRPVLRLPRLINYEQDAWAVAGSPTRDLSAFIDLPLGVRGWLDEHRVDEQGVLHLAGWAGSMDGDHAADVEITLDGRPQPFSMGESRPRVAEVLGKPGLDRCGFSACIPLPAGRPQAWIRIRAHDDATGRSALIFSGAIDNPATSRA